MDIIAHRGLCLTGEIPNSKGSLLAALQQGFGIETDIRDHCGDIIISHDPYISGEVFRLSELFQHYNFLKSSAKLALNIKSSGIGLALQNLIQKFHIENYFVFDMALPDAIYYTKIGLNVYDRVSEIEPAILDKMAITGLWIDQFWNNWYPLNQHDNYRGRPRCVVSPELHKREDYLTYWGRLKSLKSDPELSLCTDYPIEARQFFYD